MGCNSCGSKFQGVCDCCKLVDGDVTIKQVYFCETCQAYICANCENKGFRRGVAAVIDKTTKAFEYLSKKFG